MQASVPGLHESPRQPRRQLRVDEEFTQPADSPVSGRQRPVLRQPKLIALEVGTVNARTARSTAHAPRPELQDVRHRVPQPANHGLP